MYIVNNTISWYKILTIAWRPSNHQMPCLICHTTNLKCVLELSLKKKKPTCTSFDRTECNENVEIVLPVIYISTDRLLWQPTAVAMVTVSSETRFSCSLILFLRLVQMDTVCKLTKFFIWAFLIWHLWGFPEATVDIALQFATGSKKETKVWGRGLHWSRNVLWVILHSNKEWMIWEINYTYFRNTSLLYFTSTCYGRWKNTPMLHTSASKAASLEHIRKLHIPTPVRTHTSKDASLEYPCTTHAHMHFQGHISASCELTSVEKRLPISTLDFGHMYQVSLQ